MRGLKPDGKNEPARSRGIPVQDVTEETGAGPAGLTNPPEISIRKLVDDEIADSTGDIPGPADNSPFYEEGTKKGIQAAKSGRNKSDDSNWTARAEREKINRANDTKELHKKLQRSEYQPPERGERIPIESLLKDEKDLKKVADKIIEGTFRSVDIQNKDAIERFIDYALLRIKTGDYYIPSLAYPTKRIADRELEKKVISLINVHLVPDIILRILKYFARNIHDSDTNLHLAFLITSDDIIRSIYRTFLTFKKDIFEKDPGRKTLNVKMIQQFSKRNDNRFSSPLDAACRFKYILEFIALKQDVKHIYTPDMISLTGTGKT